MRKAALLALPVFLAGCSGFGKFITDTASLPGANPNAPKGDSETLAKVRGENVQVLPLLAEPGNIWPGAPPPMPTLRDVTNGSGGASPFGSSDYYRALTGHRGTGAGMELPDGSAVSAGEAEGARKGVAISPAFPTEEDQSLARPMPSRGAGGQAARLGSVARDPAGKTRSPAPQPGQGNATIVIPNGDGTSTYIAPNGTVSTRKDTPAH